MNRKISLNHLSVRIFLAVFFLLLISEVLLYQLVMRVMVDFTETQSRIELSEISQEYRNIAETYREESLRSSNAPGGVELDSIKKSAVQDIARAMARTGMQGAIFENGRELFSSSSSFAPVFRKAINAPSGSSMQIPFGKQSYHLFTLHFVPWSWEIILVRDTESSTAVMQRIRTMYLVSGGILLGNLLFIFFFVRSAIKNPMETIVSSIERGQKPSYRGIYEFEMLSTSLAKLFDEKARLVHQLLQDQVMENLRVTTRGVVHNFNNILVGALGYASLSKMKLQSAIQQNLPASSKTFEDIVKYIESIEQAAERASGLARKLSSIAQTKSIGEGEFALLDINTMLRDLQPIIRTILPRETELVFNLVDPIPLVHADSMQLEQALLNLCINSRDAMTEPGTLTVISRSVEFHENEHVHSTQSAGTYVAIDVQDTGQGMDAETQAKIFEPFFTTKPMDQGTGLGLIMVDMIMKVHNGFVLCESVPGAGTTITLFLPAEKT